MSYLSRKPQRKQARKPMPRALSIDLSPCVLAGHKRNPAVLGQGYVFAIV